MAEYSIDQLAVLTGLSERNIRLYQTRGLLHPPVRRGRRAIYGRSHIERLDLVKSLISGGMSRDLVQQAILNPDASLQQLLRLREAAAKPPRSAPPETVLSLRELQHRFGSRLDALNIALELEILIACEGNCYRVPEPELLEIAETALEEGIPLAAVLEIARYSRQQVASASVFFIDVIRRHVWEPFDAAGRPADQLDQVAVAFERPQPLPGRVYSAMFRRALVEEARRVTADYLDREIRNKT